MKRRLNTELDREMIIGQIKRLDLSKHFSVEILEQKPKRTIPQNKLYRLWLTCIAFETGNNIDDLHEYYKSKLLEPSIVVVFGKEFKKYTTTNLNTIQFKYYLDRIQADANTELSITLPNPEDLHWDEFFNYYTDKL